MASGAKAAEDAPRVLLVDDSELVRSALARLLRLDFVVDVAATSAEALAKVSEGPTYDGLIVDLQMPDGDGFTLIDRVAAIDPRLARRAVVCTGAELSAEERDEHVSRGRLVVDKGISRAELVDVVRRRAAAHP